MADDDIRTRDLFARDLRWGLVLCAVLIAGCIKPSSDFPYRDPGGSDTETLQTDTSGVDVAPDVADTDAACVPESDEELCSIEGAACGAIQTKDRCDDVRDVVKCGTCEDDEVCTDNACCELAPLTELCEGFCGEVTVPDERCGVQREVTCEDNCPANQPCDGTTCGDCEEETEPEVLCEEGVHCGLVKLSDGCGGTVDVECGECPFEAQSCNDGVCQCAANNESVNCEDGIDNDCDGLTDCEDQDCAGRKCDENLLGIDMFCRADGTCQ